MKLLPIQPEAIPLGQPLPFALLREDGTLLASKGYVIQTRPELDLLREKRQLFVAPTAQNSRDLAARLHALLNSESTTLGQIASAQLMTEQQPKREEDEADFFTTLDWPSLQLRAHLVFVSLPTPNMVSKIERLHRDLTHLINRNPDSSLLWLMHTATIDYDRYSATHSLLVSTMCHLTAKDVLGWDEANQACLCKAALTMNLSMTQLQDKLTLQAFEPDEKQRELIESHADRSADLLRKIGVTDSAWLEAVACHHSSTSGPLKSKTLGQQMARLIQKADVFSARMAPRATRHGLAPTAAMRAAYFDESQKTDEAGTALIKAVGVYPPGCLVKLATNEIAIVVRRGANTSTPKVAVLVNRSGIPLVEPIIRNTGLAEFKVTGSLAKADVKVAVDLNRLMTLV